MYNIYAREAQDEEFGRHVGVPFKGRANSTSTTTGKRGGDDFAKRRDAWAWQVLDDPELSPATKAVSWVIFLHLNRDRFDAYPGVRTIAKKSQISRSTVQTAVKELERRGHVKIERKESSKGHERNVYHPIVRVASPPAQDDGMDDDKF